nr:helix-turn-helix domain-containing protein [Mycoplasmopsis bovis]
MLGKSRRKDVVLARHIAIWIVKKQLDLSLEQIGKFFGNRDHSTIINAVRKIEKETEQSDRNI